MSRDCLLSGAWSERGVQNGEPNSPGPILRRGRDLLALYAKTTFWQYPPLRPDDSPGSILRRMAELITTEFEGEMFHGSIQSDDERSVDRRAGR